MGMFSAKDLMATASSKVFDDEDPVVAGEQGTDMSQGTASAGAQETADKAATEGVESGGSSVMQPPVQAAAPPSAPPVETVEENFDDLPLDELITNANWKARKVGFSKLVSDLEGLEGEQAAQSDLLDLYFNRCVEESSMGALDAGLDCAKLMVGSIYQNKDGAELVSQSIPKLFKKALVGRPGSKKRAIDLILEMMAVDKDCMQAALDTLRAGVKDKSPKVSAGCVQCCREAVVAFGPKRVSIQGALPVVVDAMSVKAATTRQEATKLAIDVNVRLNGAFQDLVLNSMENDASQKQLATALDKAKEQDKPDPEELKPTRKFRGEAENADEADDGGDDTDLWSMLPEVAILERLKPIKFESRIQEAKWAERKRAIEDVISMCGTPPRLAQGDYHALVFALKGLIQNDSNQAVCVAAIQLLGVLGSGLRSHFHAAARSCLPLLLSQYRINKRPLLHAVDQTLDTFAQFCLNLTEEKVVPVLKDNLSTDGDGGKLKSTPFQRFNILTWLARCIQSGWLWSATHHEPLERDGFDQIISLLVDGTSDADSKVRDVAARCVGDMTALESGEGTGKMPPYCHAKAEETLEKVLTANPKLKSKVFGGTLKKTKSGTSPTGPTTSPVETTSSKSKPTKQLTPNGADDASAPAPAAAAAAAVPKRRTGPQKGSVSLGTSQPSVTKDVEDSGEATMDLETATTVVMGLEVAGLEEAVATFDGATKWQDKVHIFTELDNFVKGVETLTCEQTKALIVYIGNRTKEFKEANFNIMNVAWGSLAGAISKAESATPLPKCYAAYVLEPALKKLGDRKQSPQVQELTLVLCEACGPRYICQKLLVYGGKQASPKALEDLFTLFASIATDFGAQTLDLKAVVELCSGPKGVGSRLPPPKNASIACITELFRQVGEPVAQLLPDSAAKVMSGKLEGIQVEGLARPKRGVKTASAGNGGEEEASAPSVGDLIPRADISPLLTAKLLNDIGDESTRESWKLRMKAIDDVNEIVKSAKGRALLTREVKSAMSELRKRFNDSNRNLATKAIGVMGLIANSVGGEGAATLTKGNVEPLLRCLGDIKKTVVAATSKTLELWTVHDGSVCRAAFLAILQQCPEVLMDSKLDRKVVLSWYIKHFPFDQASATSEERDAVSDLTKALLSILQSRDPLHRKLSTEAITTTVRFLGIEEGEAIMQSHCRDLKPAVARGLVPLLKQAYTAAGGEVASSVDSKPAPTRGAGVTSKRSNTTVSPPQGRQRSVLGERNRSSTIAVAERPQSVSAAVDRNNDPAVEQTPLEAAADECPTFKSVPSTLRDRREEKGKRNRWPTMFDEKDTHRMMEYNQALKDDMDKVVSSELLSLMFTDADRGRAARGSALDPAFQTLGFEMQKYANEVMECFDLLLKWSTIQLMNNNSTVTNHVLAFIEQLFDLAAGADYKLSDYEAAAFLPHLLTKLGEKQKRFRDAVRGIMAQVCQVFPYSKYLVYVFAEVSPNQRSMYVLSECLDELARLINTHGLSLLRVKIGVGQNLLRTVVPLVGDSRKEVRAAAMLVMEAVWEHCERNSDMLNKLFTQHKAIPSDKVKTMIEKHMQSCQSKMPQVLVEGREEPKSQIPSRSPLNTAHQQSTHQATTSRTLRLNHREPSSPSSKQRGSSRLSLALPESPKTPEMDDRRGRTRSSRLSLSALGRELDLPSTPPSPSDRKRPSSPLEPPPPLVFDDKENEGGLSTDAVAHMVDAEASPSKPAHKTISSVDSFAQALRQVEQDARGYLNVLQTKSENDEGAVRDRGIKALALIGSQSSPDGWSEAGLGGQAEWVKLIRTHVNTGRLVLVVLDMLSGITEADPLPYASMDEEGKHATNQELRMLKLTLPALLTLAWWPELRSAATSDPAIGERWVSTMCDLISRLIQQRVQQQVSVEPTSEYLHEITTERNKILKSAQTVFAKLSEGSSWLPAVIKRICKCNEVWRVLQHTGGPRAEQELRLKKVLRSSLREYAALQVSFHEAYANIATDDVVAALDNIVSVGLESTDAESAEDRAAIEDLVYSLSRNGPLLKVDLKRVPELNAFVSDVIQRRDDGKLSEQDKLALSEIFSNLSLAINESDIQLRDASLAQLGEFDSRHPSFNARAYMATSSVSGWFRDYVVEELEKQRNLRNGGTPKENQAFQSPKITKLSNAAPLEESSTNVNVSSIRERLGKLRKEYVTGSNSTPKASMPRTPRSEPSSPMSSKVVPPPLPERPKASAMVSEKVAESPAREPVSASNTLETIRERMAARRRAAAAAAALNS